MERSTKQKGMILLLCALSLLVSCCHPPPVYREGSWIRPTEGPCKGYGYQGRSQGSSFVLLFDSGALHSLHFSEGGLVGHELIEPGLIYPDTRIEKRSNAQWCAVAKSQPDACLDYLWRVEACWRLTKQAP